MPRQLGNLPSRANIRKSCNLPQIDCTVEVLQLHKKKRMLIIGLVTVYEDFCCQLNAGVRCLYSPVVNVGPT